MQNAFWRADFFASLLMLAYKISIQEFGVLTKVAGPVNKARKNDFAEKWALQGRFFGAVF